MNLFHITERAAWDAARVAGEYRAPSLATAGFIHLSTSSQWRATLERFYRGRSDLVLLEIDPARLTSPVKLERADGEDFPHLYGPLVLDAVIAVHALP